MLVTENAWAGNDAEEAVIVLGVGACAVAAVTFTGYDAVRVAFDEEPAQGWMIGQHVVTGLGAIALESLSVLAATEDEGDDADDLYVAALLIPTWWVDSLAIFSTWSLADPGTADVKTRFAVSFLGGLDLTFTAFAIGAFLDERPAPMYVAIAETGVMATQSVLTSIKAATDEGGREGWAVLAAWSGILTIHGVASLIVGGVEATEAAPPEVYDTPPAEPSGPTPLVPGVGPPPEYTIDPSTPLSSMRPRRRKEARTPLPLLLPTAIPDAGGLAPGLVFAGAL
jgi:hypothetical protein